MGVILQGILGGFSGKVGPVVGGKWKDIDYMRGYVVPSNPNTTGQQAVRLKFSNLVALARKLVAVILQPYWDMFYPGMSGFNAWMSQNYALANSTGEISTTAVMSKGILETVPIISAKYTAGSGFVEVEFNENIYGNGLATDNIALVIFDTVNKNFFFNTASALRGMSPAAENITTGLTPANVIVWIFAYRGTGQDLVVSDSTALVCSAP